MNPGNEKKGRAKSQWNRILFLFLASWVPQKSLKRNESYMLENWDENN